MRSKSPSTVTNIGMFEPRALVMLWLTLRRTPRVRFALTGWEKRHPESHTCLCETLSSCKGLRDTKRLNLRFGQAGEQIEGHKPWPRVFEPKTVATQVSLKALLETAVQDWNPQTRLSLSLILAYSLFYLYSGSWVKGRWSRHNIVFFSYEGKIPLRPFLSSDLEGENGPLDRGLHYSQPEILELGVILLEIATKKSLDFCSAGGKGFESSDDLWGVASKEFGTQEQDIEYSGLRHAIQNCLNDLPDIEEDLEEDRHHAIRTWLFKKVLTPIEDDLRRNFGKFVVVDNLDEHAANTFNLAATKPNQPLEHRCPVEKPASISGGTMLKR